MTMHDTDFTAAAAAAATKAADAPALTETARLAMLAREGLDMVAAGEDQTMAGWLKYGEALNAGRKLFPKGDGDHDFGQWKHDNGLCDTKCPTCREAQLVPRACYMDAYAAMWAADDPDRFNEVRKAHPKVRTVRGLHAKWKNPDPEPQPERRAATLDDLRKVERLRALRDDPSAPEGERANAQRKIDAIEKEVGPVW